VALRNFCGEFNVVGMNTKTKTLPDTLIMRLSIARDLYKTTIVPVPIKGRLRRSIIHDNGVPSVISCAT